MARKQPTNLRKSPRQERSKATVQAILQAAARVFVEAGLEGASTNRIAEVAGVSVGSLYQYFPNKESLAQALLVSHIADAERQRPPALRGPEPLTLRDRLRTAVGWHLEVHASNPELHEMLTRVAPRILGDSVLRQFERAHHDAVRTALAPYAAQIRPPLDLAAFMVAECMEALTHSAVVHHPELLDRDELAEEMTELLVRYLELDEER